MMVEVRAEYYPSDNHSYVNMDDSPYPDHINVESFTEPDVRRRIYVPERTCRNLHEDTPSLFRCSECDFDCYDTYCCDDIKFTFCPRCGAKVVSE